MAEGGKSLTYEATASLVAVLGAGSGGATNWVAKVQVVLVSAVNKTATDRWFSLSLKKASGVTRYYAFQKAVTANDRVADTTHIILESGDVIEIQAEVATAIDIILSGYEGVD